MSYVPHTEAERREMLTRVGVSRIEELFAAIPQGQRFPEIRLPRPLSELEVLEELRQLSEQNLDLQHSACFLGAGAYHRFIPSVIDQVLNRSEFYTAYTPYQPEISQGTCRPSLNIKQ
jgi:glycine dehydrogenase subunit 1